MFSKLKHCVIFLKSFISIYSTATKFIINVYVLGLEDILGDMCSCSIDQDYASTILFILSAAKVISFSQLCRLLSPAAKEASVLKCIQQYAVLVQGCWVVKR